MTTSASDLWRRDLKALMRLATPVAAARLGVMAMGLTDTVVVGRFSSRELGYLSLGWTLPAVAMVGAMGFLSGVQVMTSRYLGEGRRDLTGGVLKRGLAYAVGMGLLAFAVLALAGPWMLHALHMAPGLAEGAAGPMRLFSASLVLVLVANCAGVYLEALGKPGVSMTTMWIANLVNLALDLLFVPGTFGLPALGASGSAIATFGARGFLAVVLLVYIFRMKDARALGLYGPSLDGLGLESRAAAREQRRLGYGAGASQLVEAGAFSGMNIIAGWISALAVAAWAIVLNFTAVVFMVSLGLTVATAVLVGQAYGARDEAGVRRAAVLGFALAAAYGALAGAGAFLLRHQLAAAYSPDPALFAVTAPAFAVCALFLCPDALQVVAAQALRARADVLMPTITHIASYAVVMLPLGWWLGVKLGLGVGGIVVAVVVASWMSAGLLLARFWTLSRR